MNNAVQTSQYAPVHSSCGRYATYYHRNRNIWLVRLRGRNGQGQKSVKGHNNFKSQQAALDAMEVLSSKPRDSHGRLVPLGQRIFRDPVDRTEIEMLAEWIIELMRSNELTTFEYDGATFTVPGLTHLWLALPHSQIQGCGNATREKGTSEIENVTCKTCLEGQTMKILKTLISEIR